MPVHALRRWLPSGSQGDTFFSLHPQSHQLSICRTIILQNETYFSTASSYRIPNSGHPPLILSTSLSQVRGQSLSLSEAS
jgi:hypothetical protein